MWNLLSNLTALAGGSAAAASTAASSSPAAKVVAPLTPAALKQISPMSRPTSPQIHQVPQPTLRSAPKSADVISDACSDIDIASECDMLSDYEFELVDATTGKSEWVEIRRPSVKDSPSNSASQAATPSPAVLYSSVVKSGLAKSGLVPKNARKRRKYANKQRHRTHLMELEVLQARRLASPGMLE